MDISPKLAETASAVRERAIFKSHYGDKSPWLQPTSFRRYVDPGHTASITEYRPRPEFDSIPVNRVLQEFRDEFLYVRNVEALLYQWLAWVTDTQEIERIWFAAGIDYSASEVDHARKVIERLIAIHTPPIPAN